MNIEILKYKVNFENLKAPAYKQVSIHVRVGTEEYLTTFYENIALNEELTQQNAIQHILAVIKKELIMLLAEFINENKTT